MKNKPNILVCPLNWGIGHATRCVPIIRELLHQNANVIIAADGGPLAFLKLEFPELQFVEFPGYKFSYPGNGNMALKMAIQSLGILNGIRKEKKLLGRMILLHKIDGVISDNRYGLSTNSVPCIFITHQLKIIVPGYLTFLQPLLFRINMHFISKFTACWVPDFIDEPNLSGELSHITNPPKNISFIDPLTRFSGIIPTERNAFSEDHFNYEFLVLLSGPEPQRTILEKKILSQLKTKKYSAIVVRGKPESDQDVIIDGSVEIYPHLDSEKLRNAILESRIIISRPGYSTLMDLCMFGKKAAFIPTPGQTEQEFLAEYCFKNKWYYFMDQQKIDLEDALKRVVNYSGFKRIPDNSILSERIADFLKTV